MVLCLSSLSIWSCLIRFFLRHFSRNSIQNRKIFPTLCNVEEDMQTQFHSQSQQNEPQNHNPFVVPNHSRPNLYSQGSLSIPFPLCVKNMDEIWSEIHKDQQNRPHTQNFINVLQNPCQRRQAFGEMTSEDFLVKAGVAQDVSSCCCSMKQQLCSVNNNRSMVDLGFEIWGKLRLSLSYQQNNDAARIRNMSGNYFSNYQMLTQSVGEPSDNISVQKCQGLMTDWVDLSNKKRIERIVDGHTEVSVQRRQCRMIKNCESAARYQAQKQIMQRKQSEKRQKPTEKLRAMRRIASLAL